MYNVDMKLRFIGFFILLVFIMAAQFAFAVELRQPTALECKELKKRGQECSLVSDGDVKMLGLTDFSKWLSQIKRNRRCASNVCNKACKRNNPGNIRHVPGTNAVTAWGGRAPRRGDFNYFRTLPQGFAAQVELLRIYCTKHRRCTIGSAIQRWAPAADSNNPRSYASAVSRITGIPVNRVYSPNDPNQIGRVAAAMACVENGGFPFNFKQIEQGLAMAISGKKHPDPPNIGAVQDTPHQAPAPAPTWDPISPYSQPSYSAPEPGPVSSSDTYDDNKYDENPYESKDEGYNNTWAQSATSTLWRDKNLEGDFVTASTTAENKYEYQGEEEWSGYPEDGDNYDSNDEVEEYGNNIDTGSTVVGLDDSDSAADDQSEFTQAGSFATRQSGTMSGFNTSVKSLYNSITAYKSERTFRPAQKSSEPDTYTADSDTNWRDALPSTQSYRDFDPNYLAKPWQRDKWQGGSSVRTGGEYEFDNYDLETYKGGDSSYSATEADDSSPGLFKRASNYMSRKTKAAWSFITSWTSF